MRKLLLFLFMVVSILACLPAALSWAVELNMNGDFRVRGFYNNNLTDANNQTRDHNAYNTERFILNLEAKSGQGPINVQGVLTTDFTSFNGTGNSRLGQFPFGPASSTATLCGSGTATGCSQNTFSLLQAYLKVNTPYANFAVGRQVFKLGMGLLVADAVDAFVLDIPIGGGAKLTLGDLIIFNSTRAATNGGVFVGNGNGITGANTDLYLVNLNWKPAKETKVDIFASLYTDRGTNFITDVNPVLARFSSQSFANATAGIYGIAAETKQAPFHGIFEADLIRGVVTGPFSRGELLQGHNILAGADVDVGSTNFGLTLVYSSGQDAGDETSGKRANINGINGDFPLGIITTNVGARSPAPVDGTCPSFTGGGLGGRPGCFGGSGLATAKFAASYTPPTLPKVNLEFDILYDRASRQRPIQSAAGSSVFIKGGDYIGTELDFFLRYAITKEMSFTAGWGILFAGNYFEAPSAATVAVGGNPTTQHADSMNVGVLELRYQF
ncbi:MAG: hypothetical protein E6K64_00330 [Nitrospirae bacterium]|nr:MAG: hypothetical protein E6K64_00330 [Nitrospirota bacterium]